LLEGQYDEGKSHQEFLDALNAWRNVGKPEEIKTSEKPAEKVIESQFLIFIVL
jgi:hypothetical protein